MSHCSCRVVSDEDIAIINQRIAADIQADEQAAAAIRNQGIAVVINLIFYPVVGRTTIRPPQLLTSLDNCVFQFTGLVVYSW